MSFLIGIVGFLLLVFDFSFNTLQLKLEEMAKDAREETDNPLGALQIAEFDVRFFGMHVILKTMNATFLKPARMLFMV